MLVDKIYDSALSQHQSFLLDGTLSNYHIAHRNITRSLNKDRPVQILHVYQEPQLAWSFVGVREAIASDVTSANTTISKLTFYVEAHIIGAISSISS